MTLREEFEKEFNWIDKSEQPMFMSVKYIHWLESKIKQLQNTSSNKKYTAPQATPKSCPNCNSENILRNEKHNHYGCLACHHEWA